MENLIVLIIGLVLLGYIYLPKCWYCEESIWPWEQISRVRRNDDEWDNFHPVCQRDAGIDND